MSDGRVERARTMEAEKAAEVLERALKGDAAVKKGGELTIADAAAKAGLALRDAELGLHFLSSTYQGRLAATENGELLFRFPNGFSVPFTKRTGWRRFWDGAKRIVTGVGKFVLRAWITIALLGYVAVFLALAIAMLFARQGDRDGDSFGFVGVLFRVVFEALYWTFHPFSPVAVRNVYDGSAWAPRQKKAEKKDDVPFYEKVNRFVFGPTEKKADPREMERKLISQIRAQRGRIGMGDVLKVTGLPREEADPLMARLMLDYEGDVSVSDDGGISYSFPALRKSVETLVDRPPPPVWTEKVTAAPITGNPSGSNALIGLLNGFNLLMSWIALTAGLTIDKILWIFEQSQSRLPIEPPPPGVPLILGVIPLVMSAWIFLMPMVRAFQHRRKIRAATEENARRAVLRTVLEQTELKNLVHDEKLKRAWQSATGEVPDDKLVSKLVAELGGDVDMAASENGRFAYRFRDLEAEVKALEEEREKASEAEREVGAVVFRA